MNKLFFNSIILIFFLASVQIAVAKEKKKKGKSEVQTIASNPKTTKQILETQSIFIEGVQSDILGNMTDAINKFSEVIRRDPTNDAAYYELAKIYYKTNQFQLSILNSQKAIKLNPNNEFYYVYLSEAYGRTNQYTEASKTYESLIKLKPKEYDYYYDWAYMLSQAKRNQEAIDVLNLLESKVGVSEDLIMLKQPLWIQLNKIDEAAKDIDKLIALYPREEELYLHKAELYSSNRMYDEALNTYQQLLKQNPENAIALIGCSEIYRIKKDDTKRQDYLNKLFNSKSIDVDEKIIAIIPFIQKMGNDTTSQHSVYDMAEMIYKSHPNDVKAICMKADVLYNISKKEEALGEYMKAIYLQPDSIPGTVWVQTYVLAGELQKIDTLIQLSEMGIKADSNDVFGYFYNALAHQQKKQFKAAETSAILGLSKISKNGISIYNNQLRLQLLITLGDVSFELKQYAQMDSAYESALEIDPNNATLLNNYAYYLSERNVNLEKAEKMSKKSNLLEDNNSAFIDTYAWIMYKLKNYKEALVWIEEALSLPEAANRAELLTHYGDILYENGQKEKAIEQWKLALERGGDKILLNKKINDAK